MSENYELAYGSEKHSTILNEVVSRFRLSQSMMQRRYSKWKVADEQFRAYVPATEEDAARKAKRDGGEPQYTTVEIPYSYALLLTAHTYWTSVFLSRDPIFQYTGRHGESQSKVQAIEALIDYQVKVGRMLVPLYNWLLDMGKYGLGVIGVYWADEKLTVTNLVREPKTFLGIPTGEVRTVRKKEVIPGYVGNRIFNVRPFDFFPDPRVSLVNFQDGEFCGRQTQIGWNTLVKGAQNGDYFNLDAAAKHERTPGMDREYGSGQLDLPSSDALSSETLTMQKGGRLPYDLLEMCIELIPAEWGLGPSQSPEKWAFSLVNNSVIVGAKPLGLYNDQFPYILQQYEADPYTFSSRGMMEVVQPLNDTLNWLVNSHFFNVRKALNDQFLVDPSKIVMKDILEGGAGRIIRLKPEAYGSDVRTAMSQLPVQDVTRAHLADSEVVAQMLQRITGVTDNIMGMLGSGGRKTATEVRTSSSFGINRLKTVSEYNAALGWAPLSQMLVQNTQQLYEAERQFKIAGDNIPLATAQQFVNISPEDIRGFFDYVPVDGTLPIDRYAQANLWKEIIFGLGKMPQLAMQFDLTGIFCWMSQLAGLKNITQFKIRPDQMMQQQLQAGDVVPAQPGVLPAGAGAVPPADPSAPMSPAGGPLA